MVGLRVESHLYVRREACSAHDHCLRFMGKIGSAMCIPEIRFFLITVESRNGAACLCGIFWSLILWAVTHVCVPPSIVDTRDALSYLPAWRLSDRIFLIP